MVPDCPWRTSSTGPASELNKACISVDERRLGIRISRIYNDEQDIAALLSVTNQYWATKHALTGGMRVGIAT